MRESPQTLEAAPAAMRGPVRRPRLGFVGIGWIGRHRMEAIAADGAAEIAAVYDPSSETVDGAMRECRQCERASSFESLLERPLDGIVIATPSALHAQQAEAAFDRGMAVFCQKPLGRTAVECSRVVAAARAADRLLAVDFSYRHTAAMQAIRELVASGSLGKVYAVDLVFHNAYGPDKPWFRDPQRSGGGCVIDLGIHLIDLALWTLGFPRVHEVESRLWAGGNALQRRCGVIEDHAIAQFELSGGTTVRLACSWNLHAGRDAVIGASFHGTQGGARLHNCAGSFYDLRAEACAGTTSRVLAEPPDAWGGRAAVAWARRLAQRPGFDEGVARVVDVASVVDAIYGH